MAATASLDRGGAHRLRIQTAGRRHPPGVLQREDAERHAHEAAVGTAETGDQPKQRGGDPLPATEVIERADGAEQEQRFRVRDAVEERERVCGQQECRTGGALRAEEVLADANQVAQAPEKRDERHKHPAPQGPEHAALPRRRPIGDAEHGAHRAHQHGQRREERDVALPLELVVPVVAIERDVAVPARVEPGRHVHERIAREREPRRWRKPEGDDPEEPGHEDRQARGNKCLRRRRHAGTRHPGGGDAT